MVPRTIIILLALLLTLSTALAVDTDLNGELVEAEASNAGMAADRCDVESGDCDDSDDRTEALDEDSDADGIEDAVDDAERLGSDDFDTIDNAPEEKERGSGDLDGDGYPDLLTRIDETISEVKRTLERCDDNVCRQVRANADERHNYLRAARSSEERNEHRRALNAIESIVEKDVATLTRAVRSDEGTQTHRELLALENDALALVQRAIDYLDPDDDGDGIETLRQRNANDNAPEGRERGRDADSDDDGIADGVCESGDCDDTDDRMHPEARALNGNIDALDADDDGDGLPERINGDDDTQGPVHRDVASRNVERVRALMNDTVRGTEKADIRRGLLADLDDWNETVRSNVADYVRNLTDLNGSDRGLAIAAFASGNERVRALRYDNETNMLEVEHEEEVRMLGFLKMNVNARSTVDAEGRVKTRFPWWAIGPRTNAIENPLYQDERASGENPFAE